jgi:hypothetical protein
MEIARNREKLRGYLAAPRRVVLYGCGLALFSVLSEVPEGTTNQLTVVDDNPRYAGTFVPSYDIPVRRVDYEAFDGRDTVLLTLNPLYHEQVLSKLKAARRQLRVVLLREDGIREILLPGPGQDAKSVKRDRNRTARS